MLKVFTALHGKKKLVDESRMIKRVSAYTLVVHENKILLINNKSTGKWWFPGGKVEESESLEESAIRETYEEAGIQIELGERIAEVESYYYYDPADEAYQQHSSFYLAKPLSFNATAEHNEDETDEATDPQWLVIADLKEEEFQDYGWEVLKLLKEKLTDRN
jgi:8-oxo-dGTP pyrophosphatase MutT (NUDIX family)